LEKQVDKSHYQFLKYMRKKRWMSVWYQIQEIVSLAPKTVLEVGVGTGILKQILVHLGFEVDTVDIDPELKPDILASVTQLPLKDNSYDCICAFQVLEHLQYEDSIDAFKEMVRVANKNVVISLPDSKPLWFYSMHIPKIGQLEFFVPRPRLKAPVHVFDGEHHWEINKRGYPLKKILTDMKNEKVRLVKNYRVRENSYHRFFVYEVIQ